MAPVCLLFFCPQCHPASVILSGVCPSFCFKSQTWLVFQVFYGEGYANKLILSKKKMLKDFSGQHHLLKN
jgi:hypothetical protein